MARRTPKGEERRRLLCDAAIAVLADEGAKGLSHPKVDQRAGVSPGSASFYFRTRAALLLATAERVCELDLADLSAVLSPDNVTHERSGISPLAALIVQSAQEPRLSRTKARVELILQATRDLALAAVFEHNTKLFVEIQRDIVVRSQPGRDLDPAVLDQQTAAILNYVSGLFLLLVIGQPAFESGEQLDRTLAGIANGIATAYDSTSPARQIVAISARPIP